MGTEIMTIADLTEMEARVDIGEMDVVLMKPGQIAHLEVDAFKDRKFIGTVTDIANSAKGLGQLSSASSQDATKFEVRIRIQEKEVFRPGMSVNAEIETRSRTNVLCVPIASVTTRIPKDNKTNSASAGTNSLAGSTNRSAGTASGSKADKKPKDVEVVFAVEGDHVKMVPVKRGIGDDNYYEVVEGLQEGQEIVSGNFRAIRDLEDGKKIVKGKPAEDSEKKTP